MIAIKIDENDRQKAEQVFNTLGMTLSAGINLYIKEVAYRQKIPFSPNNQTAASYKSKTSHSVNTPIVSAKKSRNSMFGCLHSEYKIADDFDEPLDDFVEYME